MNTPTQEEVAECEEIIRACVEEFDKDKDRTVASVWSVLDSRFGCGKVDRAIQMSRERWRDKLAELTQEIPTTYPDYRGVDQSIPWPKGHGRILARNGAAFLIRQKRGVYATVYGLEVKKDLSYDEAALSYGTSVLHQASSEGLDEHEINTDHE